MALLDDDTLLCVFKHCHIDTLLTARALSHAVLELIDRNLYSICEYVAQNTFPKQQELYYEYRPQQQRKFDLTSQRNPKRCLEWLKHLRLKQLGAIFTECTNNNNNANDILNAENNGSTARWTRDFQSHAFTLLATLSQISRDTFAKLPGEIPEHVIFRLPYYPPHKGNGRIVSSFMHNVSESPMVGDSNLSPVPLSSDGELLWRQRWTILRKQIDYLTGDRKDVHMNSLALNDFATAIAYEFLGRPPQKVTDHPLLKPRPDLNNWSMTQLTVDDLLRDRFDWLWTAITDLGATVFWEEWWGTAPEKPRVVDRIAELWGREILTEKVIKALVGRAFLVIVHKMIKKAQDHRFPIGVETRRDRENGYSVMRRGTMSSSGRTGEEVPRSFGHVHFDLRLLENGVLLPLPVDGND